jgi:hypothetical protein
LLSTQAHALAGRTNAVVAEAAVNTDVVVLIVALPAPTFRKQPAHPIANPVDPACGKV